MAEVNVSTFTGAVLYAEFTDARPSETGALPLLADEVRAVVRALAQARGQVVQSLPQRAEALYLHADEALDAARMVMETVARLCTEPGRDGLSTRMVLGWGTVQIEGNRLRSNWTWRMPKLVNEVPQNGIAAIGDFVSRLTAGVVESRPLITAPGGGVELYRLVSTDQSEETRMPPPLSSADNPMYATLKLRIRGVTREYHSGDCPLTLGRDKTCTVAIGGDVASRVHGRITYENNKFVYTDGSRNGTYVLTGSGEEVFLRHDEQVMLVGRGAISPGLPLTRQTGEVVQYDCMPSRLTMQDRDRDDDATAPLRRH
jgi:hypothetical protein